MVEIADLRDCAPSGLFYGGRAGQKEGILIEGSPGLPSIRARRVIWRASTCHRILQARFPSIWVRISTSFWAFPFTRRCWDTVPGRSSVPAVTSPSRTRGSSSSRRSRTPFPTTMPASILRRRTGGRSARRRARRHQALCGSRGHGGHRRTHRRRARGGLRRRASIGIDARGAQATAEKTSRRGYSSASVNKAACQCGIRGYCLSK